MKTKQEASWNRKQSEVFRQINADALVAIVDKVIHENGGAFLNLLATPVYQQDATIYSIKLTTLQVVSLFCRYPYEVSNPSHRGEQQGLSLTHVNSLKNLSKKSDVFHIDPSSIVVSLKKSAINGKIATMTEDMAFGKKVYCLQINLEAYKTLLEDADKDADGIIIHPEEVMLGFLVEGHHRIEASYEMKVEDEATPDLEWAANFYFEENDVPKNLSGVFETINNKRKVPNQIMVLAMRQLSEKATRDDLDAKSVLRMLMEEKNSIFYDRIRMRGRNFLDTPHEKAMRYASNDIMLEELVETISNINHKLGNMPLIKGLTAEDKFNLFNSYFKAVSLVYPKAWGKKNYVLSKAMGISIMLRILPEILVKHYQDPATDDSRVPTVEEFADIIRKSFFYMNGMEKSITLTDKTHLLDWTSGGFGALSGEKGKSQITEEMTALIRGTK